MQRQTVNFRNTSDLKKKSHARNNEFFKGWRIRAVKPKKTGGSRHRLKTEKSVLGQN